jgi:hypothetical protein
MDAKVRENRLRRMAERQGMRLVKSRRRDPNAIDFGTYQLVDDRNCLILGDSQAASGFGIDLKEIEGFLTKGPRRPS